MLAISSNFDPNFKDNREQSDQKVIINKENNGLAVPIIFGRNNIRINGPNSFVLRRKGNQILAWCNNEMIIEENSLVIPSELNDIGFYHLGGSGKNIIVKNLYFRILH
jgi:hypothetical protein